MSAVDLDAISRNSRTHSLPLESLASYPLLAGLICHKSRVAHVAAMVFPVMEGPWSSGVLKCLMSLKIERKLVMAVIAARQNMCGAKLLPVIPRARCTYACSSSTPDGNFMHRCTPRAGQPGHPSNQTQLVSSGSI